MGDLQPHPPVARFLAAFSRYEQALDWARTQMVAAWGPIALESPAFEFVETTYYDVAMGTGLRKVLFVFRDLADPDTLVDWKRLTNQWEEQYARENACPEARPLNLDPGYLTLAKLILASTKDRDHRIYLSRGIFAENTLFFRDRQWQKRPWTYPDYQREDYQEFLMQARDYLKQELKHNRGE
jgi:hypothetical protein